VKSGLLHALHHETSDLMRAKLNDTVADLAAHIAGAGEWPELLDDLFSMSSSTDTMHRESGLLIFGQILNALSELLQPYTIQLRDILINGMNDASLSVRISGLRATTGFIVAARTFEMKEQLQSLVPAMLSVLSAAMTARHAQSISTCLEVFIDWAIDPLFFAGQMQAVLEMMYEICNNPNMPGQQQMAAEFLVSLASRQPKFMANVQGYVPSMVDTLLKRLMEVDELTVQEWNETSDEEIVEVSTSDQIEESLDTFCLALGGRVLVPHMMGPLVQLINNMQDWRARYAGLMATSLIAEGCKNALKASLADLVALVLPRLQDPHPRVRWACLNAVGQLAHDFAPNFQDDFHETVMPMVIAMFEDDSNPKVQAISATCIVSYSEKAPPATLIPYMDQILQRLHHLMSSSSRFVLEESVTCIGALAANSKEHFTPYYDAFVPTLKGILSNTHESSWYNLRSKTIDTFSIIGDAVGKEKFIADAREFMEALSQTQLGEYGKDDSMRENMLYASARICKVLGEDFIPFLPMILPSLLETASMQEDVYLDVGEDTDNGDTHRDGWQYSIIGTKKFGIHNTALEEKNVAVRMIYCFVDNLTDGIMSYVPNIVSVVAPLTMFPYHKGIRAAAATTLPMILNAARVHGQKSGDDTAFNEYFELFFHNLIDAIKDEEFSNVMPCMIDSVSELIEMIPENSLPPDFVKAVLDSHQTILTDMRKEVEERNQRVEEGNYTPEEEEEWEEIDGWQKDICTELADLYGVVVRHHPQVVLPIFGEYEPFAMTLLPEEGNTAPMRQVGLCFFDDSVEHLKEPMQSLLVHIMPYMIHYTQDPLPAVRQAASYGLGTCAQHGGAEMANWLGEAITTLIAAIETEGSREEETFQAPTENAICAVGKFILYQPLTQEQLAELIPKWLSWLPLYVDQLEARVCHSILMTLIEQNNQHLWGEGYQHLPKILDVISWCLTGEGLLFINAEVHSRMRATLQHMHQSAPELLQSAVETLSPQQQEVLSEALNSPDA